jgi:3-deoxy-D-manno-octulosonic acid (KDO) 8-phosphate synthase
VLTDVHETSEVLAAAEVADVLQIPAFLARQTALLQAAGRTGKVVNIKKGQFMSAEAALFAAEKVAQTGNTRIFLTERGTFFGYSDLVVDFRSIASDACRRISCADGCDACGSAAQYECWGDFGGKGFCAALCSAGHSSRGGWRLHGGAS